MFLPVDYGKVRMKSGITMYYNWFTGMEAKANIMRFIYTNVLSQDRTDPQLVQICKMHQACPMKGFGKVV